MKRELDTVEIRQGGITERFVSAVAQPEEHPAALFERIAEAILPAQCVALDVFGGKPDAEALAGLHAVFPAEAAPVTWVCEEGVQSGAVRAAQVWAVENAQVHTITRHGAALACVFEDAHARYLRVGGLLPAADAERGNQAREVLETMLSLLHDAGMDFANDVRTWFYNAGILVWYGDFNAVRDAFFREHGVFEGRVPASTGMGGGNPKGSALTAGLLAGSPLSSGVEVCRVDSPLQCPALDYGSSFSRAVEVATPAARRLLVSGTASIAPEGHTLHVGDGEAQMAQTFRVVEAILRSRGMDWDHVTRAIAYFKPGEPAANRRRLMGRLPRIPIVPVTNDVCRADLLFETELEAVAAN